MTALLVEGVALAAKRPGAVGGRELGMAVEEGEGLVVEGVGVVPASLAVPGQGQTELGVEPVGRILVPPRREAIAGRFVVARRLVVEAEAVVAEGDGAQEASPGHRAVSQPLRRELAAS